MSVAGLNDGSVLVREAAPRVPARPQQRPGRGMPQAVRAVLEDNIGELVEVQKAIVFYRLWYSIWDDRLLEQVWCLMQKF